MLKPALIARLFPVLRQPRQVQQVQAVATRRDRNSSITFMTAHDAKGYAEHDWRQLVRSGQALAIYMGRKSATFLQGRLLMAGADTDLVITCVENISRPEERRFTSTLSEFSQRLDNDNWNGPLIIFGVSKRAGCKRGKYTCATGGFSWHVLKRPLLSRRTICCRARLFISTLHIDGQQS